MVIINPSWNVIFIIAAACKDLCLGAKLERKQDFFDGDSFETKREYGLSEIGKRGFTSTLGYDYSSSSEYGLGSPSILSSDYNSLRSSGSGGSLSPSRDLIPPPVPGVYSSSTSPPTTRSDYGKYEGISHRSSANTKEFHSPYYHRSQISRRSPSHLQSSSNPYIDEISTAAATNRGGNFGSYGLVADSEGKLVGYRGSIIPGYTESQSIITSSSSSPDSANFIGGYFPGPSSMSEYSSTPKLGLASSSPPGRYTSTPIYYPGREEDHTYRIRDTTSQGYGDDDESAPSSEDTDFTLGRSTYQPSSLPLPPSHHYGDSRGLSDPSQLETRNYLPFDRTHPTPPFSYAPTNQKHAYDYNRQRSFGQHSDMHSMSGIDRSPSPYRYNGLDFTDFGNS